MALVTLKEILQDAVEKRYAVGSFNASNHGMVEAILAASEETGASVILSIAEVHFRYLDLEKFVAFALRRIDEVKTPVALHLDHGLSIETIKRGLDLGFSSVMIDASQQPYEENVRITRTVVELAQAKGVSVEAELGFVGGGEGNLVEGSVANPQDFTDPDLVEDFVSKTGVDALAVAIGTVHGPYRGKPQLDLERLQEIRSRTAVPLVLHGGSGLSDQDFRNVVANGINKINFYTEASLAAVAKIRELLAGDKPVSYPDLTTAAEREVKRIVTHQIGVFGTRKVI